jgi:hypothetical protein
MGPLYTFCNSRLLSFAREEIRGFSHHLGLIGLSGLAFMAGSIGILAANPAPGELDPNYTGPSAPTVDLPAMALPEDKPFVHPGLLQSQADIDFIRAKIKAGEEPWTSALKAMEADPYLKMDRKPKVIPVISAGTNSSGYLMFDSSSAYGYALLWCITGDKAYADKAIEMLNAASHTLRAIDDPAHHDGEKLLAGFLGGKYASAAELLIHYRQPDGSTSGWAPEDAERFKQMMKTVFYPPIKDFEPGFNGNWDASMFNTMLCIAVLCDDHAMFNRGVDYFLHGQGHGSISHYIFASGQTQETVRDQSHVQLGLGALASTCEIAWKQGLDLYGVADNRLAAGYEYTAKYGLGNDVETADGTPPSPKGRNHFMSIYEIVYQHYVIEKGMPMPYVGQVLQQHRPEGMDLIVLPAWGTLVSYRGPDVPISAQVTPAK